MFQTIMVPLDGSASSRTALPSAIALAVRHRADIHLVVVHPSDAPRGFANHLRWIGQKESSATGMEELCAEIRATTGLTVVNAVVGGAAAQSLADYASSHHVGLIVMASHGRTGWRRLWAGSVADDLTHLSAVPVLILRTGTEPEPMEAAAFRRTLVALDGSTLTEACVKAACAVAAPTSTVILGRVVTPVMTPIDIAQVPGAILTDTAATQLLVDDAQRYLEQVAETIRPRTTQVIETAVELGPIGAALPPIAATVAALALRARIDLVVLATRSRAGSRFLLASVADRILRDTSCALLVWHGSADADDGRATAVAAQGHDGDAITPAG